MLYCNITTTAAAIILITMYLNNVRPYPNGRQGRPSWALTIKKKKKIAYVQNIRVFGCSNRQIQFAAALCTRGVYNDRDGAILRVSDYANRRRLLLSRTNRSLTQNENENPISSSRARRTRVRCGSRGALVLGPDNGLRSVRLARLRNMRVLRSTVYRAATTSCSAPKEGDEQLLDTT